MGCDAYSLVETYRHAVLLLFMADVRVSRKMGLPTNCQVMRVRGIMLSGIRQMLDLMKSATLLAKGDY